MDEKSIELQPINKTRGDDSSPDHQYTGVLPQKGHRRKEKPWKRVFYDLGRKGAHLYEPVTSVPSTLLILLLGVYLLLGFFAQLVEDDLAKVVSDADLPFDNNDTFSEESAWRYLRSIVGSGPRVCGTPYHLQKTLDVQALVQEIASAARTPVRVDRQTNSGSYVLNQGVALHLSHYQNASNIIAVLEGEAGFNGNETSSSTLVNCHYDSVPYAQGASDNAVFCAVMMEILKKLSRRQTRLKHNIVFLFNGAEENGLQGSHAFLSHPWFRGVTSVVNLDSAGINGKATLFQVTDPRVLSVYRRRVRKPNAQSFGEFLFASGLIPSDTDFRVWRDFSDVNGIDIAFAKGGHVYHTRYDHVDSLNPGVMQYSGDLLMGLLTELADSDQFDEKIEGSAAVYYDYLNWFLVEYSYRAAYFVDAALVAVAGLGILHYVWLVGFRWSTVQELLFSTLGRVLALLGGILPTAVLTPIMVATTVQLRYLSHPWIVVAMFWIPWLAGAVATSHSFDWWRAKESGMNRSIRAIQAQTATRLILLLVSLVLLCVPGTAMLRYLLTVPLLIMSAVSAVSLSIVRAWNLTGWQHLLLEVILSLPSTMFVLSLALRVSATVLPVMGRTPSAGPDYLVGVVSVGLVAYCAATVSGIELLFSRKRLWMVVSGLLTVCAVVMFIPMVPYQDDGPATQRHYWFHTEVVSYNYAGQVTDSVHGVFASKQDAYTIDSLSRVLAEKYKGIITRTDFSTDCAQKVYCNLPLYRPRFADDLKRGIFLYTGAPAPFRPAPNTAVQRSCVGETCLLQFRVVGPPHNLVTLWPVAGAGVAGWSFPAPLAAALTQSNRAVYTVALSTATYQEAAPTFAFNVTMTVPLSLQSGPILLASHHAHKIHHPEDYTAEYRNLLEGMPKYFNIASFMTIRTNYEF